MSTGLFPKAVSFGVTFLRWLPITATYIYIKHRCQRSGKLLDHLDQAAFPWSFFCVIFACCASLPFSAAFLAMSLGLVLITS